MIKDLIEIYFEKLQPEKFGTCTKKTPNSLSCFDCFRGQYFNGNMISYDCIEKRYIYFLRYFFAHYAENYKLFQGISIDLIEKLINAECVNILSIGGGPGSDVFGVLDQLNWLCLVHDHRMSINVVQLDGENQWCHIFDDIESQVNYPNLMVRYHKLTHNINKSLSVDCKNQFDVITASYLVSELNLNECLNVAGLIDFALNPGGLLMINDRNEQAVTQKIESIFDNLGIKYRSRNLTDWAGFFYPEEIANLIHPKLSMNSIGFIGSKL